MRTLAFAVTLLCVTHALPAFAASDEGQGALVEKVAVRNRLFTADGRFELGATAGFALLSRLTEHYTFNLDVGYNIVNTFAIELIGGYSYARHTSLARDVAAQFATNTTKTVDDLKDLWEMTGNVAIGIRWQPLYGKIGGSFSDILLSNPVHFQFYLWAGGGVGFFHRESVVICNHKTGSDCDAFYQEQSVSWLASWAGGLRLFLPSLSTHQSVKIEMRGFLYPDPYYVGVDRAAALNSANPTGNGTPASPQNVSHLTEIAIGYTYLF